MRTAELAQTDGLTDPGVAGAACADIAATMNTGRKLQTRRISAQFKYSFKEKVISYIHSRAGESMSCRPHVIGAGSVWGKATDIAERVPK